MVYADAYQRGPAFPASSPAEEAACWREAAAGIGADLWPWVFLNRIVGYRPRRGERPDRRRAGFAHLRGLDLDGEDRAGLVETWRGALRTARKSGAPGIVVDPEAYNDHRAYDLGWLERVMGRPRREIRDALLGLGAELADVTAETYPEGVLWWLFSGLAGPAGEGDLAGSAGAGDAGGWEGPEGTRRRSPSYVALGLLERARARGYRFTLVSGGELHLGYCNPGSAGTEAKVARRAAAYAVPLARYPNLVLGGVVAPWLEASARRGWIAACPAAGPAPDQPPCVAEDFIAPVAVLAGEYRWLWTYGAGVSDYSAYREPAARRWAAVLAAAGAGAPRPRSSPGGAP